MKLTLKKVLTSSVMAIAGFSAITANAEEGIRPVSNDTGIIYFSDEGWTGSWNFICLGDNCIPGQKVGNEWQREVSGLVPGNTYGIQIKVQDNATGQHISGMTNVVFEGGASSTPTPTPTPIPATPTPNPATPTPTPVINTPTPTPVVNTPTPTPVVNTPTPTPVVNTPTPTPVVTTPTPTPIVNTPTPTPGTCGGPTPAPLAGDDFFFGVNSEGVAYHVIQQGTGFVFLCVDGSCDVQPTYNAARGRYEVQAEAGQGHTLEFKYQFADGNQCIMGPRTFESGTGTSTQGEYCTIPSNGGGDNAAPPAPPAPDPSVGIRVINGNAELIGGEGSSLPGFTLYTFDDDRNNVSNCSGGCADNWPPLVISNADDLIGAGGVTGSFGTIERERLSDDGCTTITEYQVTYNGAPLYFFANDNAPGDTNGANINGWNVAIADLIPQMPVIENPMPALKTPVTGKQPGSHGYTFDLNGRNIEITYGESFPIGLPRFTLR